MEILNEDYVGKVPRIQQIEDLFRKHQNPKGTVNSIPFIRNQGKIVDKIEKLLCEEFNFEEIVLFIDPSARGNSYTCFFPTTSIYDDLRGISNDIVRTKNGGFAFKDKRGKYACIVLDSVMFDTSTPEEIMGVLLHEVGHSFNKVSFINKIFIKIGSLFFSKEGTKSFINYIKGMKFFQKMRDKRVQEIEKEVNKRLQDDITILGSLNVQERNPEVIAPKKDFFVSFVTGTIIWSVISAVTIIGIPLAILKMKSLYSLFDRYKGEIDADKFAAMYGYSKGLSKNLTKAFSITEALKNANIKTDKNFIIEMERKVHNFILALLFTDEHPDHAARVKNNLKYLDDEIIACKNPRIKKILIKERKETEEVLKDYANRLNKKTIDTSMDDIKREFTYRFAGSDSYEERAK